MSGAAGRAGAAAGVEPVLRPALDEWARLLGAAPRGSWRGVPLSEWRARTRRETGLDAARPIIATGHQTLLWHPGILAKYLAVQAVAGARDDIAAAHLIVDQHVGDFGAFEVPLRRPDGSLAVGTVRLTAARDGVPMGRHPAFAPATEPPRPDLPAALPCVEEGMHRIRDAVAAHAGAPNAALQMAGALGDLMSPWVARWPGVCAADLMRTSLARMILQEMAADPGRCAACYNAAVAANPQAGVVPLAVTGGRVELPVWTLGPDGRRVAAGDGDLRAWLAGDGVLLPRALLLTLLVRAGMCDLYVHGTGGAAYDGAMEQWARDWLGLAPAPMAVVTATLRLPLGGSGGGAAAELAAALHLVRGARHDPETPAGGAGPGPAKRALLAAIDAAPRRSGARAAAFGHMHRRLEALRAEHAEAAAAARRRLESARRRAADAPVAARRDWPFPLYPVEMIDALAGTMARRAP